jgi:radical SAM protein with 4Fe4S-binding SPASM domain
MTDAAVAPPLPRFAQIEPTGRCNLACRMCTVNHRGDAVADMPLARFEALLDQMPGLEQLHLQGLGEPMLHPDFFAMVRAAAARGIRVSANTNLTLLTPARAELCATSGLAALSVSLDGASAAVYEGIRAKASFAKVLRNLRRLTAARDAAGGGLQVRGVMVLMRANLAELPAMPALLAAHGAHELLVQRLSSDLADPALPVRYIPIRRYVESAELGAPERAAAEAAFAAVREAGARHGVVVHLPSLDAVPPAEGARRCGWPWEQLYVTAAGELLPCCMVATADRATFGNVFDAGGLAGRWGGEAAARFRQALDGAAPPAVCRSCALYHGRF